MHLGIVIEALVRVTLWGIFGLRSPQGDSSGLRTEK